MTTNDIQLAASDHGPDDRQPQPTFSWPEVKQGRLTTRKIYLLSMSIWRLVTDYHQQAGTPRGECEPTELAGSLLAHHYNTETTEKLEHACREDLDPLIQEVEERGTQIDTLVQAVAERDLKLASAETGLTFTEDEAVDQVEKNTEKIHADTLRGRSHHKRVPGWVRVLGKITPYAEALGLIVLLSFWLNVEWTRPWEDSLTWTLAVVVVLATLLFTPRVVERAGEGWNGRREAIAEGQRQAAEAATRKLLVNGLIATVVCGAIVAGLVERALAVTDDTLPESMLALIIALCVIAGSALPAIAFLAKAWDGSSLSRENDDLIEQLEDGRVEDQKLRTEVRALNLACEQDELHITTEVVPAILRTADEAAEEMRCAYAWLRVQIGGLPSAPPPRPVEDLNGVNVRASIATGVPGAEPIRLTPLVTRGRRVSELRRRRDRALARLDAMPAHPWSGNQYAA